MLLDAPCYEGDALAVDLWSQDESWDPDWVKGWGSKPEEFEAGDQREWQDVVRPLSDFQRKVFAAVMAGVPAIGVRGGWGCAKTATQALILWYVCSTRPGVRCMWVTDTSVRRETVVQIEAGKFFLGARYEASRRRWVFPNGSCVWLREYFRPSTKSSHQNPLEGPTMHAILVDECQVFSTSEVLNKASGRLRQKVVINGVRYRPFLGAFGLPVANAHWIRWVEKAEGVCFYPTTFENLPNLDDDYIEFLRKTLDPDEFEALVNNKPMPVKGTVFRRWRAAPWPEGNLIQGWKPNPEREVGLGIDFGRTPALVFFQHDPDLGPNGLDVIFHEICLVDVDMEVWIPMVLKRFWPKSDPWGRPDDPNLLTLGYGAGDKAGANRDSHGRSDLEDIARKPADGGIGLRVHRTTDPSKTDIATSLKKLHRRMHDPHTGERRLVMTEELWKWGLEQGEKRLTLAKSILGSRWREDGSGVPIKDGKVDHFRDALRYLAMFYWWFHSPLDDRVIRQSVTQPKKKTTKRRTRPRSGQGRPTGF